MDLRITLLGGFQVELDGRPLPGLESDKARALLAYLASNEGRPQPREQLAALLWPDFSSRRARRNLSQALYNLRRTLEPRQPSSGPEREPALIQADGQSVCFNADGRCRSDVIAFQVGLAGCPHHNPAARPACVICREQQEKALDHYQGPFLAGLAPADAPLFEEWVTLERERLHRAALATLNALATWHRREGRAEHALTLARRAVALEPLWEPAQRQLMHALWLSGERAQALAQYETCRRLLQDELGVVPDEQTRKLHRRILIDSEVVSPQPAGYNNLPCALTSFVGRQRTMHEIVDCLSAADCRLLSLVGPGGSGKSRLAVEAARRLADAFPDGVFLASLSPLDDPAAIVPSLAQALDLPALQQSDQRQQLLAYLQEKRLLLIMDGFERLVEGAGLVVDILRTAAGVKVLVTSRVRLSAKGEHVYPMSGLDLPDETDGPASAEADAVQLFLSAARRTVPDYQPEPEAWPAIARICRQVDGMPLGLILASGWLPIYSPAAIADEIARSLDFLAVDWADLPQRQRSLRATLAYSWGLLDQRQQAALAALAVFRGGFSAEAAAAVAGVDGPALLQLVERSVVQSATGDRFIMHDLLRQFAAERLAETPAAETAARRRHADHFTALLARVETDLQGAGQQAALARVEADDANVRAAWAWAAGQGQVEWVERALDGMGLFYELLCRAQAGERASGLAVAALRGHAEGPLARALAWRAGFARLLGRDDEAQAWCRESRALLTAAGQASGRLAAEASAGEAFAWLVSGDACVQTDREAARGWYRRSLERYREHDDRWGTAVALERLGQVSHLLGEYSEALQLYRESLALYQALGEPRGIARTLVELGNNSMRLGLLADGERYLRASVEHFKKLGDRAGTARSWFTLGRISWWLGRAHELERYNKLSCPLFLELGLIQEASFSLAGLVGVACFVGKYQEALSNVDRSLTYAQAHGLQRWVAFTRCWQGVAQTALGDAVLGQEELRKSVSVCRELGQTDELASSLAFLGLACLESGQPGRAREHLREAVEVTGQLQGMWAAIFTLPLAALLLARQERVERALEIFALITRYPAAAGTPMLDDLAGRHIRALAAESLSTEAIEAAEARGRALELWPAVAELAAEMTP